MNRHQFLNPQSLVAWCGLAVTLALPTWAADAPPVEGFLRNHCADCHQGEYAEAGLDLNRLGRDLANPETLARWVRIVDRVGHGEMPPKDAERPAQAELARFVSATGDWIRQTEQARISSEGRVAARRLTNLQLERTLHDLLGIDLPLANQFPEEPRTHGFTTVADGQPMSHFQLSQHLDVIDLALDEAFRRAVSPPDEFQRHLSVKELCRQNPKARNREPELLDGRGVVWSSRLIFYGRLPSTTARESGWYRFKIRAASLKQPEGHGVWCTVRTGQCVSSAPLLGWAGAFEAKPQAQEWTFEAWLEKGQMFEVRPGDDTLKMGRFAGGQVGAGEGGPQNVPGVAIEWLKLERFHPGPDNDWIRQRLFGGLKVEPNKDWRRAKVIADVPREDTRRLMLSFAEQAFRRPVTEGEILPYIKLVHEALADGASVSDALRGGYRALLCSPRFLYFHEQPGKLDSHAVAARLSYLLWNRPPDGELLTLAAKDQLRRPEVVRKQVRRMLAHEHGQDFVKDFADQWLDLSQIDFTEPDRRYNTFDIIVQQSMLAETQTFLQTMLDENLSVTRLIDSDFTFLNSRLARYYKIPGVDGDPMRRVALPPDSPRGGVLGQGAILKVTANGTTTSPVIRGVWVSERLLGEHIPPPPANVPAIEPDIRGAKSIREMLAKHRESDACASCHVKIDPPGFALENFDPAGGWRDRYPTSGKAKALPIDASFTLPDGRPFDDIHGFRKHIIADADQLARNVVQHVVTYGTGAPVGYADREAVDRVVAESKAKNFGLASLVEATVTSPLFLNK
jgi:hypothetical protein